PEIEVGGEQQSARDRQRAVARGAPIARARQCPNDDEDGDGVDGAIERGGDGRNRREPHEDRRERNAQDSGEREEMDQSDDLNAASPRAAASAPRRPPPPVAGRSHSPLPARGPAAPPDSARTRWRSCALPRSN